MSYGLQIVTASTPIDGVKHKVRAFYEGLASSRDLGNSDTALIHMTTYPARGSAPDNLVGLREIGVVNVESNTEGSPEKWNRQTVAVEKVSGGFQTFKLSDLASYANTEARRDGGEGLFGFRLNEAQFGSYVVQVMAISPPSGEAFAQLRQRVKDAWRL
ncbi:MAG: hypothetical protein OXR66_03565 [Candidatus Woesearchaeota archaeon]|nr:hypothetical protein [Candidatus Woesearchaeota archaeon]